LKSLNTASWQKIQQQMAPMKVDVHLPRLESDTDIDLIPIMGKLGMTKAFTSAAEFPNFCNTATFIGLMKQVAKIKLDEEGTEAAAVTVIGMEKNAGGSSEPDYVTFYANHPFLYIISEKATGAIFFIGQYTGY
jgi:serpin B